MPSTPRTPRKSTSDPYSRPTPQSGSSLFHKDLLVEEFDDMTPCPICDDQLEEDTKPDLNDDETEVEPNLGSKAKRTKRMRTASGGKAVGKAWTGQEDCILFPQLHPKAEVEWNAMAAATGRDAKSCQNRYTLLSKKLEGAIKGIGRN